MPNNYILTQNLHYNYYYPKTKWQIIGYLDPLGDLGLNAHDDVEDIPGLHIHFGGFRVWGLRFGV